MEELKQNEQIQTPKTKKTDEFHLKQITIIALAIFITFCCCILFFFVIYRYNGFTDFWKKLTYILQPVIMAYYRTGCGISSESVDETHRWKVIFPV